MPTPGAHVRLRADEGEVDGDEPDQDVVDGVEAILHEVEELGGHS